MFCLTHTPCFVPSGKRQRPPARAGTRPTDAGPTRRAPLCALGTWFCVFQSRRHRKRLLIQITQSRGQKVTRFGQMPPLQPSRKLVNFHSYLSFAVWHWSKDSAFSSSSEASGLDPSSPLCYSILDVPAVCSELDWHLRSPPHCPSRFCQTRASPVRLPAADSAGLPSARLPALGKQQFEFCLLRLTEL